MKQNIIVHDANLAYVLSLYEEMLSSLRKALASYQKQGCSGRVQPTSASSQENLQFDLAEREHLTFLLNLRGRLHLRELLQLGNHSAWKTLVQNSIVKPDLIQ